MARESPDVAGAPPAGGFGRVARIVVVACVVSAAALTAAILKWKAPAALQGDVLYHHRDVLRAELTPPPHRVPRVVWLGDSTVVEDSYPQILEPWLEDRYQTESRLVAFAGMSTYNYYSLMGPALDLDPTMVVFLVNLRMFRTKRPNGTPVIQFGDDLVSMIPASELPHALALPWMARGISLTRLLMMQSLRLHAVERGMELTEGLGGVVQASHPWELVASPPAELSNMSKFAVFLAGVHTQAQLYDVTITPRQPYVQMMVATIRMAVRRGVPVVVIASPIPIDFLKTHGYEPEFFLPRFAALRALAEAAGATFLDLHDVLPQASFKDNVGHYTPQGAHQLAEMLKTPIANALTTSLARRAKD